MEVEPNNLSKLMQELKEVKLYEKDLVGKLPSNELRCKQCDNIPISPLECSHCDALFCKSCLVILQNQNKSVYTPRTVPCP